MIDNILDDAEDLTHLVPELREYVDERGNAFGQVLNHPLVQSVFGPILPHHCNAMFEQKTKMLAQRIAENDYLGALPLYERPWRLLILSRWWNARTFDVATLRNILA